MTNLNTTNLIHFPGAQESVDEGVLTVTHPDTGILSDLGSSILAQSFPIQYATSDSAILDGRFRFSAIRLAQGATLTGIRCFPTVTGDYTGDNNNRAGLYSYSSGTITLVASCSNNANLWKSTAGALQSIPFSATYDAQAGFYIVGMVYNNSAQVTAPSFAGITVVNAGIASLDFTNSAKMFGLMTGQTDLPASQAMSGVTATSFNTWFALY